MSLSSTGSRFVGLLALSISAGSHAAALFESSGPIYSSTGTVPSQLGVYAQCDGNHARIFGEVKAGKYRFKLPVPGNCMVQAGEWNWDALPLPIMLTATGHTAPLPVLVHPREVPEPALASEFIEMGKQDKRCGQGTA